MATKTKIINLTKRIGRWRPPAANPRVWLWFLMRPKCRLYAFARATVPVPSHSSSRPCRAPLEAGATSGYSQPNHAAGGTHRKPGGCQRNPRCNDLTHLHRARHGQAAGSGRGIDNVGPSIAMREVRSLLSG
jgi:hypothetical protein